MEKNYLLRCKKCKWARRSTGLSDDLKDLKEISNCAKCGKKYRTFRCGQCGDTVQLIKVPK